MSPEPTEDPLCRRLMDVKPVKAQSPPVGVVWMCEGAPLSGWSVAVIPLRATWSTSMKPMYKGFRLSVNLELDFIKPGAVVFHGYFCNLGLSFGIDRCAVFF
ncbi:hypothetical protein TNCV_3170601 [Trichonephila clavipes]|nr:hypothetical protein TNCV_3170601 [Trichonephila clavipes]